MNKKSKTKLLEKLDDLSLNVTNNDVQMATEFLKGLGIDADEEAAFGLKEIQRTYFLAKAHQNQARDKSLLQILQTKIKESFEKNASLTGQILQNALGQNRASFQFRNIENWSEDEMRDVLSDIEITKLLEDLDNLEE
jgi:hypothetical protein